MTIRQRPSFQAPRSTTFALSKALLVCIAQLPYVRGAPTFLTSLVKTKEEGTPPDDPNLWLYLGVAALLVLLGGAFAGLTIALMGQDEIYLQVIKKSGEGAEKKHATKVLGLLHRGKHWVLVTLLLGNVITNETLPIVLDRSLGGGWPAVLGSTVLIVIFGEIAPQSVCVRYGLPIGSFMAPFVLGLMYILAPIAWPTAQLLDWLLGEDHGTTYKKSGLKTLVSLHRTLGDSGQQLNSDEVTIISAVLDLKEKTVGSIMTPMDDVFTLSVDDILDEETMDVILSQGYSRVPIHAADNDMNFVGMLLIKILITYDPEDAKPVRDFALATLPETSSETSCLDIVNFFQEGKSHMVLVSMDPGGDSGALGVVTLEDVIEELIGEEIIDESDVFIDVHKAIRRLAPAPRTRVPKGKVVTDTMDSAANASEDKLVDISEDQQVTPSDLERAKTLGTPPPKSKNSIAEHSSSPRATTFLLRRRSSAAGSDTGEGRLQMKAHTPQMREHLKHLGPSNLASRPKTTRFQSVKIKPGTSSEAGTRPITLGNLSRHASGVSDYHGGIGEGLLNDGGMGAKDGAQAVAVGYGTIGGGSPSERRRESTSSKSVQTPNKMALPLVEEPDTMQEDDERKTRKDTRPSTSRRDTERSQSTVRSLRERRSGDKSPGYTPRGPARSGSITENIIDANGIRKVVLQLTASGSSDDSDDQSGEKHGTSKANGQENGHGEKGGSQESSETNRAPLLGGGSDNLHPDDNTSSGKKKRRRRRKHDDAKGEQEPLLHDG